MNKKNNIKAHDILSSEEFSEKSFVDKNENIDDKEIQIARIIYGYLSPQNATTCSKEKEQIRAKLKQSVQRSRHKNRRVLARWAVAASIIVAVFSVWFLQDNLMKTTEIEEFAETLIDVQPDTVTNLLLQDGRKVLIRQKESQIAYDKKGEKIVIDSTLKVSQQVMQEKQVFNTLVVPYGKRTQITLSDGSKVWLNSGSKLVYPANLKEKRKVFIEGEAVFEVTHSEQHPFLVVTKDFEIKVLGTVFNVCAYSEDKFSSAVLKRGKIELSSNPKSLFGKDKLTILPGTMAVFDSDENTFHHKQVDAQDYLSWRDGYFIFKNEPLANIVNKLERYYNVEIILESKFLGQEKFSGNLNLKDTPEEVLRVIAETTPFLVRYENEKLIINLN